MQNRVDFRNFVKKCKIETIFEILAENAKSKQFSKFWLAWAKFQILVKNTKSIEVDFLPIFTYSADRSYYA